MSKVRYFGEWCVGRNFASVFLQRVGEVLRNEGSGKIFVRWISEVIIDESHQLFDGPISRTFSEGVIRISSRLSGRTSMESGSKVAFHSVSAAASTIRPAKAKQKGTGASSRKTHGSSDEIKLQTRFRLPHWSVDSEVTDNLTHFCRSSELVEVCSTLRHAMEMMYIVQWKGCVEISMLRN